MEIQIQLRPKLLIYYSKKYKGYFYLVSKDGVFIRDIISERQFVLFRKIIFNDEDKKVIITDDFVFDSLLSLNDSDFIEVGAEEISTWPSWRKHLPSLPGFVGSDDDLIVQLDRLFYDKLANYMERLTNLIMDTSVSDLRKKRPLLSVVLQKGASHLSVASRYFKKAAKICSKHQDDT